MCALPTVVKAVVMETPIWNQANLIPPPVCTVKSKWDKDVRILNCTVKKVIATLDSFDVMLYETKLLAAVINQFKFDFRLDKSFQLIKRVAHCLKRCQLLNIKEVFRNFEKICSQCNAFDYQPSRQMLEYVLVRVQGFIMLLKNLVNLCHESALHLKAKMEIGHFPSVVLTLFSVVSRIWSLSKYYIENALEWYLLLVSSLHTLEPTQVAWLPSGYVFPALPFELHKAPWIDQEKIIDSLRSFVSDFKKPAAPSTSMGYLTKMDDLGETISREDLARQRPVVPTIPVQKPVQQKKAPSQSKPTQEKKIHNLNKPIQEKKANTSKKPINEKKIHLTNQPIQVREKPDPVQKTGNEPRKRKISDSEPETPQPTKHFFKKKYSRPVVAQTDSIRTPEPKLDSPDITPSNIVQELAKLKQDFSILGEKPKSKLVGLDPKYKSKVVVVQEKSTKTPEGQSAKIGGKLLGLDRRKDVVQDRSGDSRQELSGKMKKLSQVGSSEESQSRLPDRGAELRGGPSKKSVSKDQRRLEKRKELAKLRKQKSKAWVIS